MNIEKKIKIVEQARVEIESAIREKIREIGTGQASKILEIKQPTLSQFVAGTRKFSLKKLREINDKLGREKRINAS